MLPALFVYDENFSQYRFSADHPFNPRRLAATHDLLTTLGWLTADQTAAPDKADHALLELAHSPYYIDLVERLSDTGRRTFGIERLGLGTEDNPVFEGMHDAASLAVGGTVKAAQAIVDGVTNRALNLSGGLHHAGQGHASGFCIYNDVVTAARWIRRKTGWRVLYVETDAHHGDGVQDAFYDDPDVFFLSLHESGRYLFPGTGSLEQIGGGSARGTTLNIPLEPATDDHSWLDAYTRIVPEVMRRFRPDIVISQHGCDGHYWDPLADMCATTAFYHQVPALMSRWVDEYARGRWIATGGGGYQLVQVVPRSWTHLLAVASGEPIDPAVLVPEAWRALAAEADVFFDFDWRDPDAMPDSSPGLRWVQATSAGIGGFMRRAGSWPASGHW